MVCHCKPPQDGKMGCADGCLNRMLNIECVRGTCPCGDLCSNQQVGVFIVLYELFDLFLYIKGYNLYAIIWLQFQKRKYANLNRVRCGKKGYGLETKEDIREGRFLIEYVGEVTFATSFSKVSVPSNSRMQVNEAKYDVLGWLLDSEL